MRNMRLNILINEEEQEALLTGIILAEKHMGKKAVGHLYHRIAWALREAPHESMSEETQTRLGKLIQLFGNKERT